MAVCMENTLLFQAETCLRAMLWRPQRREKLLFVVQRRTVAMLELPLQSVTRLPSTETGCCRQKLFA